MAVGFPKATPDSKESGNHELLAFGVDSMQVSRLFVWIRTASASDIVWILLDYISSDKTPTHFNSHITKLCTTDA